MKSFCAELMDKWKVGNGEHSFLIKLDDDRVKSGTITLRASDVLGYDKLESGDHLTITIRKVEK